MTTVSVVDMDITQVEADAMIVAANTMGYWGGGIDKALQRVSGRMFFDQIAFLPNLADGQVIYAPATGEHNGRFKSVIFAIDDVRRPLGEIVVAALQAADRFQLAHISLPALRTGALAGFYEHTPEDTADAFVQGIQEFVQSRPAHVRQLTVVTYNNIGLYSYLNHRL